MVFAQCAVQGSYCTIMQCTVFKPNILLMDSIACIYKAMPSSPTCNGPRPSGPCKLRHCGMQAATVTFSGCHRQRVAEQTLLGARNHSLPALIEYGIRHMRRDGKGHTLDPHVGTCACGCTAHRNRVVGARMQLPAPAFSAV